MKALITGAAGFIGSHVAERLAAQGHEVLGVDSFSDYYAPTLKQRNAEVLAAAGVEVLRLDLSEPRSYRDLPRDFDFILHFAAQPGIDPKSTFESYLVNNIIATRALLDFAEAQHKLLHFFNIGTSSVYGAYARKSEEMPPEPTSFYGVTKLAAEQLALAAGRRGILPASSLRLYSVYGPRERPDKLYTRLIKAGLERSAFPLYEGSLDHMRSFTYVNDIADGVLLALKRHEKLRGEIVNLGNPDTHTTREGIAAVEGALGKSIALKRLPPRPGDQIETSADITKARALLGYRPTTTLAEGVARQIQWYQQNLTNDGRTL